MLESSEAAKRLGVKLSSLYVYVSRGLIDSHRSPDGRRSLFRVEDVELLASSRGGRRTRSRQATVITAVTQITDAGPAYRGMRATTLLGRHFEDVAELLWQSGHADWFALLVQPPDGLPLLDRVRFALLFSATLDPDRGGRGHAAVHSSARRAIATVVASLADGPAAGPSSDVIADQIATAMQPFGGRVALSAAVDAALCLLADHEMATSTRAARLAAGSRAGLHDAFAAGLGVLVGPLHGGAGEHVVGFLRRCSVSGVESTFEQLIAKEGRVAGFATTLYPSGDPRFAALRPFVDDVLTDAERDLVDRVLGEARRRSLPEPTVDFALGALVWSVGCNPAYATAIFATARMAGWTAHYLEELSEPPVRDRTVAAYATRS